MNQRIKDIILLLILTYFVINMIIGCTKEVSCEGCLGNQVVDTIIQVTPPPISDTAYNDLIVKYEIPIKKNSGATRILPQISNKLYPGHYKHLELIKLTNTDSTYKGTYNLKNHIDIDKFYKGDTIYFRCEVRWKYTTETFTQHDTLIY